MPDALLISVLFNIAFVLFFIRGAILVKINNNKTEIAVKGLDTAMTNWSNFNKAKRREAIALNKINMRKLVQLAKNYWRITR
jgi:hypothetical protein